LLVAPQVTLHHFDHLRRGDIAGDTERVGLAGQQTRSEDAVANAIHRRLDIGDAALLLDLLHAA
jgi:hypothetical protein